MCIAWTMPWQDVCPSVCLSVTRWNSVDTAEHILKFFLAQVVPTFSFFSIKRDGNIPTGTPPLTGASNAREKNHYFPPISRFISEMMQNRAIVTMEGE